MQWRELTTTTPVFNILNDGGPIASVSKGELHALTSQTEVGRRARSKVRARFVGSHSLGWFEVLKGWGAEVEAVVVSRLGHYKDIRQLLTTTPTTADHLANDLLPLCPWDGCLAAYLITAQDVAFTSTLFK
jgi:hypothetical protein